MIRPRRLIDLYNVESDKPLTDTQARKIVALLGLAQPRHRQNTDGATGATVTPIETTQQHAS